MLTPKQIRFVDEYLIDLNGEQAAIRAGYSPKSARFQASKLLADSNVSQQIKLRQAASAQILKITREDLIRDLIHIKDRQKDAFPPSAIKAIEVIAKMLGLNEPEKIEHSGSLGFDLLIPGVTPKQIDDGEDKD